MTAPGWQKSKIGPQGGSASSSATTQTVAQASGKGVDVGSGGSMTKVGSVRSGTGNNDSKKAR